ncbi:type III PLP-dependent enzyme [Marivita sp. S6314]|uniref:type III PLP-dependent enzyme n=1 Tax=Marivita sp. S6314 TaxID=2926406 RepID=UPI001FF33CEF|nr:type III PLP-dependent enzyme [Marivita sp. S6314]MCK0149105.1 type III PLP-dependent enzyme [Marivita sp. S6314]
MVAGAEDIKHARFETARDRNVVSEFVQSRQPDIPVFLFRPDQLRHTAARFLKGFPGAVSYAVKANPHPQVLQALAQDGITTFDVASVAEMHAVRAAHPKARLHYHNPVRSRGEIAAAKAMGVASWSVDRASELDKLADLPSGSDIAVRLTLPMSGAAYDFGTKFGARFDEAVALLRQARQMGHVTSMTFHPGTQCTDPTAWTRYIAACADAAQRAGVRLASLNVGGGFPALASRSDPSLAAIFDAVRAAHARYFPDTAPQLWCEPGRAMVSDAMWLLLRVKTRSGHALYMNDGVYGALGEWRDMAVPGAKTVLGTIGQPVEGPAEAFSIFGPTCDSLDVLPSTWQLPVGIAEEDYILVEGAGAYTSALVTGFNGYGASEVIDLTDLHEHGGQDRLAG